VAKNLHRDIEGHAVSLFHGVLLGAVVGCCFGWEFSREKVNDLAGWAQAIGSVLAICGAAWVARWQFAASQAARDAEIQRQGIAVAVLIRLDLGKLHREIQKARTARSLQRSEVHVPEILMNQIDRLWMMGGAGAQTLRLISYLKVNLKVLEKWRATDIPVDQLANVLNGLDGSLELAEAMCKKALDGIEGLLDDAP